MSAGEDQLRAVRDIGPEVACSIREYFAERRNREGLQRLLARARFKFERPPETAAGRGTLRFPTIDRSSVGRARAYDGMLGPLLEALGLAEDSEPARRFAGD